MLDPKQLNNGEEQHEVFFNSILRKRLVQYDYRSQDGELFSCVATDLVSCRDKKRKWLEKKQGGSR